MLYFWKEILKPPQNCTVLCGFQRSFLCTVPFESETGSLGSPVCPVYGPWSQWWAAMPIGPRGSAGVVIGARPGEVWSLVFSPENLAYFAWRLTIEWEVLASLAVVRVWLHLGKLLLHVGSLKERCGAGVAGSCVAVTLGSVYLDLTGDVTAVSIPVYHVAGLLLRDRAYLL